MLQKEHLILCWDGKFQAIFFWVSPYWGVGFETTDFGVYGTYVSRCMDPITKGQYPKNMQALVGRRLPKFSKDESEMLKGSFDFLGLNYYTANYATDATKLKNGRKSYLTDSLADLTSKDPKT